MNKYDYIVIGSGPAGHNSAIRASQLGMRTAVIEKDPRMFGGVCLNEGCIPAKSLYHSAKIISLVKNNPDLCGAGSSCCGNIDLTKFIERSRRASEQLREGLRFLFKKNGIDLITGTARFTGSRTVEISGTNGEISVIEADKFLIASGSAPRPFPGTPFDGKYVIASSDAIRLAEAPESILIIGGGAIGTEFASYANILGTDVSIVEIEESLLPYGDSEISRRLRSVFKKRGITCLTSTRVTGISIEHNGVKVSLESPSGVAAGTFSTILVAMGRIPTVSGLGLSGIGLKTDEKGFIPVNGRMQTAINNIYAAGDVIRTPMLAHTAAAEGEIAAEAAAGLSPEAIDYSRVPDVVYSDIEVASVGITEDEAKKNGMDFKVGKQFFKANGRAAACDETEGFVKIIADKTTGKLLGAHILGGPASELIHEFALALHAGLSADAIKNTIHAHPTFSEASRDACNSICR
ncbi:MAG: dihydrolipoyl dehydrogenase [Candidatus Omnitrophota bacterium]